MRDFSPWYETFILRLAQMESVAQIEGTLRGTYGLEGPQLRSTLHDMIENARQASRPAEQALLLYLATITDRVLPNIREQTNILSAAAKESLDRARHDSNPMIAYYAIAKYRDEFSDQVYENLRNAWFPEATKSVDAPSLRLLYLIALASGNYRSRLNSLLLVARYRTYQGAYGAARTHYRRAVRIARDKGDKEALFEAASAYASWLVEVENYSSAVDMFQEAMAAAAVAYEGVGKEVITLPARYHWGIALRRLGCYHDALVIVSKTLSLLERLYLALDMTASVSVIVELESYRLRNHMLRGLLYMDIRELDLAEGEFDVVAVRAQELNLHDQIFEALIASADVALVRGDDKLAKRRYSRIVSIAEQWGDPAKLAAAYNNRGRFEAKVQAFDEALESYWGALYYSGNAGAPTRTTCIALMGLGDAYGALGDKDIAFMFYLKAYEKAASGRDSTVLMMLLPHFMTHNQLWDASRIPLFDDTLPQLAERLSTAELTMLASTQAQLRAHGDATSPAIRTLRHAIELISERNPEAPEITMLRVELGRLLTGDPSSRREAFSILTEALEAQRPQLAGVSLGERRSEIAATSVQARGTLLKLLLENGTEISPTAKSSPVEQAFAIHEAAKAPSLAGHLGRVATPRPESVPPPLMELESRLLAAARQTAIGGSRSERDRRRRLRLIESELQDCWKKMQSYADHYVRLRSGQPATLSELKTLIEGSQCAVALASFFCDQETTTCFVIQPGEPVAATRLPVGREHWVTASRTLSRLFNGSPSEWPPYPPIRRDRPDRRDFSILDQLSNELIALMEPVRSVDLLCIAPHGPLHVIPFHALRGADGRYLIERFGVTYTPSLTALTYMHDTVTAGASPPRSSLVAGLAARDDAHPEYFEDDDTIFTGLIDPVRVLNGPDAAVRQSIYGELPNYDIVHLTCHGFYDHRDPLQSGLIVGNGRQRPPKNLQALSIRQRREYLITAEDLLALQLKSRLVTLRACSTALVGERNAGDEFDGLTRSFIYAGARAVLASQWNVDQRSSHALVSAFYKNWLNPGASQNRQLQKWQALQLSQLGLLNSTTDTYLAHPYHWGALALLGDWS